MIYTDDRFDSWATRALKAYQTEDPKTKKPTRKFLKKGYLHFDHRIWLPDHLERTRDLLRNPNRIASNPFYPFVRWVMKTPRYKRNTKGKVNKKGEVKERILELKERPIAFASHRDALIYSFYAHVLTELYEKFIHADGFNECVLAYRSDLGLSNVDFGREVFEYISQGPCTAIALDVTGFFDNLDHSLLKTNWKAVIGMDELPIDQYKIFRSLTKYSYVNRGTVLRTLGLELRGRKGSVKFPDRLCEDNRLQELRDKNVIVTNQTIRDENDRCPIGIPQGSPLSAILSNIYMIDYDRRMHAITKERGFLYRRYCDDIMIVCPTEHTEELKKLAMDMIREMHLEINEHKADVVSFDPVQKKDGQVELRGFDWKALKEGRTRYRNLQYLGFEFDGVRRYIRSASMAKFYRRMMARVGEVAKAAVGNNAKGNRPWTRKLYDRLSFHGTRNFPTYAFNAAADVYELGGFTRKGMDSPQIRKQMAKHVKNMQTALNKKVAQRRKNKARREVVKRNKALASRLKIQTIQPVEPSALLQNS